MTDPSRSDIAVPLTPVRDSAAPSPTRTFIDDEFREWCVREIPAPAYDRRQSTVLVFDTVGLARRMRSFPANWRDLSDEELLSLSRAVVTAPPAPAPERVCCFRRGHGVSPLLEGAAALHGTPSDGRPSLKYSVSVLTASMTVLEGTVWCDAEPSPAEQHTIYRALFPDQAGIFTFTPTDSASASNSSPSGSSNT
jgi:hypothetical protein